MMHTIFTYGTLMAGLWNNHFLEGGTFLRHSTLEGPYVMYIHRYDYPCLVKKENEERTIYGELWEIDDEALKAIDFLEGVDLEKPNYTRELVDLPDGTKAWVYLWGHDTKGMTEQVTGNFRDHVIANGL